MPQLICDSWHFESFPNRVVQKKKNKEKKMFNL